MQIIIVHSRLAQAKTLTLRPIAMIVAGLSIACALVLAGGVLSWLTVRHEGQALLPLVDRPAAAAPQAPEQVETASGADFVRQNLDVLAIRLGEMQARLTRLDALGDRVAGMVGIRAGEIVRAPAGRGGALSHDPGPLSLGELSREIDRVSRAMEQRGDHLSLLETEMVMRSVMNRLLPHNQPLEDGEPGSRFGWRTDPITGRAAMHEGIDFNAPTGTPIVAAGAGVVVFAGWHPGYGRQVDIDHGDGVVTRYAHASRLLVKEGDIVRQGQRIAEVGSTGRSTGPHLHFEVRVGGEPRDPLDFLRKDLAARPGGPLGGLAAGAQARR